MSLRALEFEPAGISVGDRGGVDVWCYTFYWWTDHFDIASYAEEGVDREAGYLDSWEEAVGHAQLKRELLGAYEIKYFYSLGCRTYSRGGRPIPTISETFLDDSDGWRALVQIIDEIV